MLHIPDAAQLALLAAPALGVVHLVELEFAAATHRFTSFNRSQLAGGHEWQALGSLLSVGDIREGTTPSTQTIPVRLSTGEQAVLALALGNVEAYRGRPARVYLGLVGADYQIVGVPRLRFTGYMEPVKIDRDSPGPTGGAVGGAVELPISRAGMARARNNEGLRLTHEQHSFEHPGDRFLEYVQALIKTPTPWISKAFQKQ